MNTLNKQLLEDYLNGVLLINEDEIVLGNKAEITKHRIEKGISYVFIEFYLCGEFKETEISLFDLISFVYSKI